MEAILDNAQRSLETRLWSREAANGNYGKMPLPESTLVVIGGFIGVAWMCQFEIIVMCYLTFKRCSGLYFWSIVNATLSLILYTIAVVLNRFVPATTHSWASSILLLIGYVWFVPSEFLVMYSRLCLLKPGWKMTRFIQILLATEDLFVELPATIMTLVAIHNLDKAHLVDACRLYIAVGAVLLPVVCIVVPAIYLYMAIRMFGPDATRETKDLLICISGGTLLVFAFQGTGIGTWFTQETSLRGCWLPLLFSMTLLVEFWNLNILGKLASSTLREAQGLIDVENLEGAGRLNRRDDLVMEGAQKYAGCDMSQEAADVRTAASSQSSAESIHVILEHRMRKEAML